MNIQIKATEFDLTETLKEHIETRIGDLQKFIHSIEEQGGEGQRDPVEVFIELGRTHGGQKKGSDIYQAEIQFHLPHTERIVVRAESWDIHTAIDKARHEMKDRLLRHKGKQESKIRRARNLKCFIRFPFLYRRGNKSTDRD
ncbi:MAG: ribosome-associated translation inhibitor RaiA [Candidatus Spechtbacteria bacterium SB0662_bin_43]|uniref:Ribosome-associated translation inhibitor RaiA n=1 Tax=Candidatus Spechtbacteria bacterium SB0662_bin_43 TaxID=2604897 RepID=A0A845DAB3_9BACT|nr:ribosome-associated translation inhibitor RaiA [Candidatus Spechtbacteria bacterium SB0662_bin_43]